RRFRAAAPSRTACTPPAAACRSATSATPATKLVASAQTPPAASRATADRHPRLLPAAPWSAQSSPDSATALRARRAHDGAATGAPPIRDALGSLNPRGRLGMWTHLWQDIYVMAHMKPIQIMMDEELVAA